MRQSNINLWTQLVAIVNWLSFESTFSIMTSKISSYCRISPPSPARPRPQPAWPARPSPLLIGQKTPTLDTHFYTEHTSISYLQWYTFPFRMLSCGNSISIGIFSSTKSFGDPRQLNRATHFLTRKLTDCDYLEVPLISCTIYERPGWETTRS